MTIRRLYLLGVVATALLGGCLPQTNTFTQVALINAPEEYRVEGLAGDLERTLRRNLAPGEVDFVPASRVAYQEGARDIRGSQAVEQAAIIARVFGAEYSVMVAGPGTERTVLTYKAFGQTLRSVTNRVQLEAVLVDAASAGVTASYPSGRYVRTRVESVDEPLVDIKDDPDRLELIERALQDLSRPLATDLALLASYAEEHGEVPVQDRKP